MRSLIIGASGGIGAAMAGAARARGDEVVALSRRGDGFDLGDPASVTAGLAALEGVFDRIVIATGILAPEGQGPEKSLRAIEAGAMAHLFAINAIGPALVLAGAGRLLPKDRPSALGVLSARVGSIGDNRLGGWHSYRASKAALNQILRGAAIELGRSHPKAVLLALHPGTVATPFTASYGAREKLAPEAAAAKLWAVLEGAQPEENGSFMDYAGLAIPW